MIGQKNIARYISAQQQNYILRNDANMYIRLIRNEAKVNAITGRLVIDGRWFCNTLERKGVEIPALCYHVCVTQSPKFKRLLPIVQNVPRTGERAPHKATSFVGDPAEAMRQGIRIHRGSKPEHSSGCVLVVADNKNDNTDNLRGNQYLCRDEDNLNQQHQQLYFQQHSAGEQLTPAAGSSLSARCVVASANVVNNKIPDGCRSAADVEQDLTSVILKAQNEHEEIILEVSDFRAGTEYGYNTPCPSELQKR